MDAVRAQTGAQVPQRQLGRTIGKTIAQQRAEQIKAANAAALQQPEEEYVEGDEPQDDGEGEAAPETTPQTRERDPANTKYERARRAFLRAGVKEAEFRKIDRDEAIRRGIKLERQQDQRAAEVARLKAAAEKKGQGSTGSSTGETQSRVATPSDESLLTELFTKLDLVDDPAAQATLKSLLSPVLAERAQLRDRDSERNSAEGSDANQALRIQTVRTALSETIPELSDNDDFLNHVAPAMQALAATTPRFARANVDDGVLRELMQAAAFVALEEVGERREPAEPRSVAGRGFMDSPGHTRRSGAKGARSERDEFMAQVTAQLAAHGLG